MKIFRLFVGIAIMVSSHFIYGQMDLDTTIKSEYLELARKTVNNSENYGSF